MALWPSWLLFLAVALFFIGTATSIPLPKLLYALVMGTCVGVYCCATLLTPGFFGYIFVTSMFNCAAIVLVGSRPLVVVSGVELESDRGGF